nr:MAG: hypothetical protein [Bacteriophage sp.]
MVIKYRYWQENLESSTGIEHDSFDELSEKELYKQIYFLTNHLKLFIMITPPYFEELVNQYVCIFYISKNRFKQS